MTRWPVADRLRRQAAQLAVAPPDPSARHVGSDAAGIAAIRLSGSGRGVDVRIEDGWRRAVGPEGLGAALVQAYSAAALERLVAWAATVGVRDPPQARGPVDAGPLLPVTRHAAQSVSRAWADLAEFRLRLRELHESETSGGSPNGKVTVVARTAAVIRVEIDERWLADAGCGEIELQTGRAFEAALDAVARLPDEALDGCPDLRALLAASPIPNLQEN